LLVPLFSLIFVLGHTNLLPANIGWRFEMEDSARSAVSLLSTGCSIVSVAFEVA
jgi:hypothetical protein